MIMSHANFVTLSADHIFVINVIFIRISKKIPKIILLRTVGVYIFW